ncbi:MAG TPA: hypothetical protein VIN36_05170 [Thiobacillus sp.]
MAEPRLEGPLADLKFRERAASAAPVSRDRFWLGTAIFLGVAAIYPFYSYHVHTRLAARDVSAAVGEFTRELDEMADEADREQRAAAQRRADQALAQRQRGVSLAGTTIVGGRRIAIVSLGSATLAEAEGTICRQASRQFGESLAGQQLRVQRHRGSQPAVDAGTITCP